MEPVVRVLSLNCVEVSPGVKKKTDHLLKTAVGQRDLNSYDGWPAGRRQGIKVAREAETTQQLDGGRRVEWRKGLGKIHSQCRQGVLGEG